MTDQTIRIRANRRTGELEIEGHLQAVAEWWERIWPEMSQSIAELPSFERSGGGHSPALVVHSEGSMPKMFGEFFTEFRSDITDVDKILVAATFIQGRDQERVFTTKAANQALLDQNIKVANASENVRRLIHTKSVFVVSDGKYRVSAGGIERVNSLRLKA